MPSTPQARCAGARAERLVADGEDGDSVVASINSRIVAAPPVPYLPRLRALALFGRRSVEREEPPRCRRPKTCTKTEVAVVTRSPRRQQRVSWLVPLLLTLSQSSDLLPIRTWSAAKRASRPPFYRLEFSRLKCRPDDRHP